MPWRDRLKQERALLAELVLMLVLMLVVGLYFLERLDTGLEEQQRWHLQALAAYLAADSSEYLAADNRVSLGVIARQAAALKTVAAVAVRDTQGRILARAGARPSTPAPIQQPITGEDGGSPLGRLDLWPAPAAGVRQRIESGFVLVVLLLLALRVLAEVIRRQLRPVRADKAPSGSIEAPGAPSSGAQARLWIRLHEPQRLRTHYTASLLERVLAEHRRLLDAVARYYGARVTGSLDRDVSMVCTASAASEALFRALCAGEVFLRAVRESDRPGAGRPALAFEVWATSRDVDESEPASGAAPDTIRVPGEELDELELTACVELDPQRRATTGGGESPYWQTVMRLAPRYERLIRAQARTIIDAG